MQKYYNYTEIPSQIQKVYKMVGFNFDEGNWFFYFSFIF